MDLKEQIILEYLKQGCGYPELQEKYGSSQKRLPKANPSAQDLEKKITALEKQLQWEKLRADALDTMINVAEEKLHIAIRKKPGSPQSRK